MISSCVSALVPSDFYIKGHDKTLWSRQAIESIIRALGGDRVIVVTNAECGFAEYGVTLDAVRKTPGYGTYQVLVSYEYKEGEFNRTWKSIHGLGAIITIPGQPSNESGGIESVAQGHFRKLTLGS